MLPRSGISYNPALILSTRPNILNMRIVLAPMEGLADVHLRRLITAQGGYDWVVSEFVRVVDKLYPPRVFQRISPELLTGGKTSSGTPVRVQLLGSDSHAMADNAARAVELGSYGLDINFGCPSKTVNRRQGGAILLKEPENLYRVVSAVRRALPKPIIVSAKMRLGFEDTEQMLDNALALQAGGADEITVHGRTRSQGYRPPVYWPCIGEITSHLDIPVIANGDVVDTESYARCQAAAGTADVMLGRGAVRQPDLAAILRDGKAPGDWPWFENLLWQFWLDISQNLSGKDRVGRVKQWLNYLRQRHLQAEVLWQQVRLEKDPQVLNDLLDPGIQRATARVA